MNLPVKRVHVAAELVIAGLLTMGSAYSAELDDRVMPAVLVTGTRVEQASFNLPTSIDSVDGGTIRDMQLQTNLSESLARVPGLLIQNRQNYAQDLQISLRGFGARSTFGVRGIRLYVDNIPATMPDGQGQLSHVDLGTAERIEVLRGPFSALYGNSSGGVLSVSTEEGAPGVSAETSAAFGSYGTRRIGLKASGDNGTLNYVLSGARFETEGYRAHSAATRTNFNAKLQGALDEDSRMALVLNAVDMPEAQDPLGLDRSQFNADPRQAGTGASMFNTRKRVSQVQGGLTYTRKLSDVGVLTGTTYYGERRSRQFQAIPAAAQGSASSPGGLIDLQRDYDGLDLRWTGKFGSLPLKMTAGATFETLGEWRRGFQNFIGSPAMPAAIGVVGSLRRDEKNRAKTFDQYVEVQWDPSARWMLLGGLRHSSVRFSSTDKYLVNGNDSGSKRFSSTNPVLGVTFKANSAMNLYASVGRGFETPTLNELAYRRNGTGLNFDLNPASSDHVEVGVKALLGKDLLLNAAVFRIDTHDEIAVLTNSGGRSVFQNVGRTARNGAELTLKAQFQHGFGAYLAYSYIDARYRDNFQTCVGSPCTVPSTLVKAGNAIPGIPRSTLFADLTWKHSQTGFESGVEIRRNAHVFVNDVNDDAAPAYTVASVRGGFRQRHGGWRFNEFVRIDNLTDRKYAGSVIVNETNRRYFEPAPGRALLIGATASYTW